MYATVQAQHVHSVNCPIGCGVVSTGTTTITVIELRFPSTSTGTATATAWVLPEPVIARARARVPLPIYFDRPAAPARAELASRPVRDAGWPRPERKRERGHRRWP